MIQAVFLGIFGYFCQQYNQYRARSWTIIPEIQESYKEFQEWRKLTKKSKVEAPNFVGLSQMQCELFLDFAALSKIFQDSQKFIDFMPHSRNQQSQV